jgi:tetratricopeptide (TPR) repeat protein
MFEEIANPIWEAEALNTAGWYHARLGQYGHARTRCERARELNYRHAYRDGEAHALDSLGYIAYRTGRFSHALIYYQRALAIRRDLRDQ